MWLSAATLRSAKEEQVIELGGGVRKGMQRADALDQAERFTNEQVELLRQKASEVIQNDALAICIVGSYGRREASPESDLDFFFLTSKRGGKFQREIAAFKRLLKTSGIRMPSKDGAFDSYVESIDEMVKDIGGFADRTEKLTRRLLFLLEGDYLYNRKLFEKCRQKLIGHYVRPTITEHQLCRFLLNDLIRYYRTICVDFECKTHQDGKSWGDRNIKLQFSRKLLYFSGILVTAETWQSRWETKREILENYLSKTPLERLRTICGSQAQAALTMYSEFLDQMSDPVVRQMLRETTENRREHSVAFRKFKNTGHHFTIELSRLLSATYDESHPIHLAIRF